MPTASCSSIFSASTRAENDDFVPPEHHPISLPGPALWAR
jgi:hypothetical protein